MAFTEFLHQNFCPYYPSLNEMFRMLKVDGEWIYQTYLSVLYQYCPKVWKHYLLANIQRTYW